MDMIAISLGLNVSPNAAATYGSAAVNAKNIPAGKAVLNTFFKKDPSSFLAGVPSRASRTDPKPATHIEIPSIF